ncbi:hypothetical protein Y032_0062g3342 [Ancylostoma ceylanicum]|uniref:Uncharacterized protein n=1 Tax=Ancylostoma ceylanicum TaxID=53326 RepID=A0A016U1D4_9BILA|nr:hypothetical protein Y032_0062g3342 [Ancylostoma ceylanicum]
MTTLGVFSFRVHCEFPELTALLCFPERVSGAWLLISVIFYLWDPAKLRLEVWTWIFQEIYKRANGKSFGRTTTNGVFRII